MYKCIRIFTCVSPYIYIYTYIKMFFVNRYTYACICKKIYIYAYVIYIYLHIVHKEKAILLLPDSFEASSLLGLLDAKMSRKVACDPEVSRFSGFHGVEVTDVLQGTLTFFWHFLLSRFHRSFDQMMIVFQEMSTCIAWLRSKLAKKVNLRFCRFKTLVGCVWKCRTRSVPAGEA